MNGTHFLEVFEGEDGQWYVRLKHINGNKIMTSEPYVKKGNAVRSARKVSEATSVPFKVTG